MSNSLGVTVDFRHIRLEPADNGFILNYTEVIEKPGTFEDRDHMDRNLIFGEEEIDKALAKMKELFLFNKNKKGAITAPSIKISVEG